MKKTIRKRLRLAGICVAVLLVGIGIWQHHLIWVLMCNWFQETSHLPDSTAWSGGTSLERIAYAGESENQYLDLYLPDSEEPLPLLFLIHGGGFIGNDSQSRQAQFMFRYFRDHGFACASVNYRLAQEAPYPAAVEDVRSALHYLAEHHEEYHLDMERIAVWGESAGGYLAARLAVTEDTVQIRALVDHYGIMDFPSTEGQFMDEGIPRFVRTIANGWMDSYLEGFDSCEEFWTRKVMDAWTEEERQDISAIRHAEKNVNTELKSLILHGDADILVPYDQSFMLHQALMETCGEDRAKLELVHGYPHAGDAFYSDRQLEHVEAFLRSALKMP